MNKSIKINAQTLPAFFVGQTTEYFHFRRSALQYQVTLQQFGVDELLAHEGIMGGKLRYDGDTPNGQIWLRQLGQSPFPPRFAVQTTTWLLSTALFMIPISTTECFPNRKYSNVGARAGAGIAVVLLDYWSAREHREGHVRSTPYCPPLLCQS